MPSGGSLVGFTYFATTKAVGYTAASALLRVGYRTKTNVVIAGVVRTLLGVAVGATYGTLAWLAGKALGETDLPAIMFFVGLIPVRIMEWYFFIWWFFDRTAERPQIWQYTAAGVIWSFLIDAAAIFAAFVMPGGFWIC